MIKKCTCKHNYQDKIHGQGNRVHNPTKGRGSNVEWRCTVCNSVKGS